MAGYEKPFGHVLQLVKPDRDKNKEKRTKENFWIHKRPGPDLRVALAALTRCVAVVRHSKHLIFSWLDTAILPDDGIYVFARNDDLFFGLIASQIHSVWALAQGTQVREKESGFRYTPTTCFETFPFPFACNLKSPAPADRLAKPKQQPEPDRTFAENLASHNYYLGKEEPAPYGASVKTADEHRAVIAAAAKELNELRERWLNPPEWTETRMLEFPGTAGGPWSRYVAPETVDEKNGIGTVRYPRLEPKDAECAAKLKKRTLTNLYNERPAWLDLAHKKLDAAVAAAYGWPADLSDEQILEKLLALNLERAESETNAVTAKVKEKKSATRQGRKRTRLIGKEIMAVPDFQSMMLPFLQFAADGKEHELSAVTEHIAQLFRLTPEDREDTVPSGNQTRLGNRVGWCRTHLKQAGLIEYVRRGVFRISAQGKQVLAQNPPAINLKFLNQFPAHSDWFKADKALPVFSVHPLPEEQTPEERMEELADDLKQKLAADILERVKAMNPFRFERVVLDLLVAMGYGGSRKEAAELGKGTNDGGIDGLINEDRLGLDRIYVQAKRWQSSVGRPEIQNFVGALAGQHATKGVFITSSEFSLGAVDFAKSVTQRVVLIDGRRLAELMIEHNIGVSHASNYEIKRVDSDYFEEE